MKLITIKIDSQVILYVNPEAVQTIVMPVQKKATKSKSFVRYVSGCTTELNYEQAQQLVDAMNSSDYE